MDKILEPTAQTLAGIRAFRGLGPAACETLAKRCQGRRYPAGHDIVCHADSSRDVYFLVSGRVRATLFTVQGKEVAFRDLGPGVAFGDLSAIDGQPRCATVRSLEQCALVFMSAEVFWDAMMEYPCIAGEVLKETVGLVRQLTERIVEFSTLDVKHRLYCELLRLVEEAIEMGADGPDVELTRLPTHEAIANRINTHREAVTKELNRMAKDSIVAKRPGALIVRDVDRLRRVVLKATGT